MMPFRPVSPHRLILLLAAALAALLLAGCITIGAEFRHQAVEQIEPGETTQQQLLGLLGNPVRTGITDDGALEWTYAHYKGGLFARFEGRDLVIKFDDSGRVQSFSYHTTDATEKLVQRK